MLLLRFVLVFIFFGVPTAWAKTPLQCLGAEEALLHQRKVEDAYYWLNQLLVKKFSSYQQLSLKDEFISRICHYPSSIKMLKHLMLYKENLFLKSKVGSTDLDQEMSSLNNLIQESPEILSQVITQIQVKAPPNCFLQFPEIRSYISDLYYKKSEPGERPLFFKSERLEKIFAILENYAQITERCRKESLRKDQQLKDQVRKANEKEEK